VFATGAAAFTLVAVSLIAADSDAIAVGVGVVAVAGTAGIAYFAGVPYAIPAAMAGYLAFDWYRFPPTHPHGFPDSSNLLDLLLYLGVAGLIGECAAYAERRRAAADAARAKLAEEQAALARVATLVAHDAPPEEVFAAVAEEAGQILGVDATHLGRYEDGDAITTVGRWSTTKEDTPIGTRSSLEGENVSSAVLETGHAARVDSYERASGPLAALMRELGIRSSVGVPIVVEGSLWGAMVVSSKSNRKLPPDTEARTAAFTELVATAVANTEARTEVRRLADEQAGLRHVATLVARESPASDVFQAVVEELNRLLETDGALLLRYEGDGTASFVAAVGEYREAVDLGRRMAVDGDNVTARVFATKRPARIDDYAATVTGEIGTRVRREGTLSAVGAPIVVEGRLWGVVVVGTRGPGHLPSDTESRMTQFADLVATAISNIEARANLAASRARLVTAADQERRRVVRDLHDGAQQRLVHTVVTLRLAQRALEAGQQAEVAPLVTEAFENAERATDELRELARGILPAVLTEGGLRAAVEALASRMPVPVENRVDGDRFAAVVEATAYFVVAEALTNVAKHAHASCAEVTASVHDAVLEVAVHDDGVGGARRDGNGLVGLADRLAALDGHLDVECPPEGGTRLTAVIPLARGRQAAAGAATRSAQR
jgi:signal transduction histidine kinase